MAILDAKVPPTDLSEETTRERILNAAGEVFAEQGFEGATVRAITQRAGVNVAAINYHFGDKAELYSRLILDACASQRVADAVLSEGIVDPQRRLRSIIFHWLQFMLDPERPQWKRLLLAREMANPTIALDQLVENSIRPMRDECLGPTLRELTEDRFGEKQLRYLAASIMGQCQYYLQSRPVLDRLYPGFEIGKAEINELADHITRFSLAAITEMTRQERQKETESK
jgi:TetR/AcrR family transcriptional regulator, regulator of cefoperazone and chloramphenicol sensitivity